VKSKKYNKTAENDYVFKNFKKRFVRALLLALSNMLEEKLGLYGGNFQST